MPNWLAKIKVYTNKNNIYTYVSELQIFKSNGIGFTLALSNSILIPLRACAILTTIYARNINVIVPINKSNSCNEIKFLMVRLLAFY